MGSLTGIPGSIADLFTNIIPNLIPEIIANPEKGLALSVAPPLSVAAAGCEALPGCSSLELPT